MGYQDVLLQGVWPPWYLWVVTLVWIMLVASLLNVLIRRSRDELVDWL